MGSPDMEQPNILLVAESIGGSSIALVDLEAFILMKI